MVGELGGALCERGRERVLAGIDGKSKAPDQTARHVIKERASRRCFLIDAMIGRERRTMIERRSGSVEIAGGGLSLENGQEAFGSGCLGHT